MSAAVSEQPAPVCSVCRRGEPPVCERCRQQTKEQLAALPGLRSRLRTALVPGSGGGGERVSTGKGEAPLPARLAALSLIANGSEDARCTFVPAVRVWTTTAADGSRIWHREQTRDSNGRRVMALADDQTGPLPVAAWLRAWSQEWRRTLGHTGGAMLALYVGRSTPQHRQRITATQLGIARAAAVADRPDDPVEQDWDERWPAEAGPQTIGADCGWGRNSHIHHTYLSNWLPEACERLPQIGDFTASLRTLTGALRAALGDVDDVEYLGRCPEELTNRAAGTASICGAPIWHDPYASVITCPRCHTETGQDRRIWLARRILDAWPIDRRRRYPRGLIEVLRRPACVTCSSPVRVEWVSATEHADREPFWRPGAVTCPMRCELVL